MSLQDRIKEAAPEPRGLSLDRWLDTLTETDLAAVRAIGIDPEWSNARLVTFLNDEGVRVGKDRIAGWRSSLGFRR